MTLSHSAGKGEELIRHYADVRRRLMTGAAPLPRHLVSARSVRVQAQSHRPDYVPPQPALPLVRINEATRERVRDVLHIASTDRETPMDALGHWREIIAEVCAKHGVTKAELESVRRALSLVRARQEAMYRMSKETSLSLPMIGRRLGDRDHTTVIYGIRRHEARMRGEVYDQKRKAVIE